MSNKIAYIMLAPGEKKPENCEWSYGNDDNGCIFCNVASMCIPLSIKRDAECPSTGRRDDCLLKEACPECKGRRVVPHRHMGMNVVHGEDDCPTCHGKGMIGPKVEG